MYAVVAVTQDIAGFVCLYVTIVYVFTSLSERRQFYVVLCFVAHSVNASLSTGLRPL